MQDETTDRPSVEAALAAAGIDLGALESAYAASDAAVQPVSDTVAVPAPVVETTGQPAPVADVAPAAPAAPVAPAGPPPGVPVAPELDPADRRVQALMQREAALRDREATIVTTAREAALAEAKRLFQADPAGYVRSQLAPDAKTRDVATDLWHEELGDAAPPEYQTKKQARAAMAEVARLRTDIEARDKRESEAIARKTTEEANARSEADYLTSLRTYATTSVPDSMGRAKALAKHSPDMATRMMHDAARMLAVRTDRIPTPEETATEVEKYLESIGYAIPAPAIAAPPPASAPASLPTTTIRNAHSATQPALSAPDDTDPKVLRRNALAAAGFDPNLFG